MVANEIAFAIFAEIFLFTVAIKTVFLYILSLTARTFNWYLYGMHNLMIPKVFLAVSVSILFELLPFFV